MGKEHPRQCNWVEYQFSSRKICHNMWLFLLVLWAFGIVCSWECEKTCRNDREDQAGSKACSGKPFILHFQHYELIHWQVQEVCERQLATLHKLAPNIATNPDSAMDGELEAYYFFDVLHIIAFLPPSDVCLPALFMPTPTSRPVIYNPRAHSYFHPPGSEDNRVSQPPAIFKLPPVQQGVSYYKMIIII